ncbi:hypothetical protein ACH50_21855 [Franconibacter pulveris]|uniref:Uncharacterized protein n=1 Tax=Franconibacter pulveris TaxID=435910 RepID=A0A0J8Y5I0_9ENTR|nr:hypothetical protein ACH50_21855 [Franconibacter pulveris]
MGLLLKLPVLRRFLADAIRHKRDLRGSDGANAPAFVQPASHIYPKRLSFRHPDNSAYRLFPTNHAEITPALRFFCIAISGGRFKRITAGDSGLH